MKQIFMELRNQVRPMSESQKSLEARVSGALVQNAAKPILLSDHDPLADLRSKVEVALRNQGYIALAEVWQRSARSPHMPPPPHEPPAGYKRYRNSNLWKTIRARVLERDGHKCHRCQGAAKNTVHHRSYADEVMRGEADKWLVSICEGCHTCVHKGESGVLRTWEDQEAVLATPDLDCSYPVPKIDLRRKRPELPSIWGRMNANQRLGWHNEADKPYREKRLKLATTISKSIMHDETNS